MSIYALATKTSIGTGAGNPVSVDEQASFKGLVEANLAASVASNLEPDQRSTSLNNDRGAMIDSFLMRLWQSKPVPNGEVDFSTPIKFIKSIAEPAKQAAAQLGTSPQVVIAIAALETGWGKHVIERDNGQSSHNLFGIKSTGEKPDSTVFANTTEYIDGQKYRLEQPFRTYSTAAESVGDFASFIRSNPRYENALRSAHSAEAFIDQIHHAGYATDPNYAAKVKSVMANVETLMNSQDYQRLK